jgi:tRNA dimethylallyltransferase
MSLSADSADADRAAEAPLPVIIGPTAAGKSAIALRLARERGLAIISADSRQVYRDFDIGTAKPGIEERRQVPHYGIDVVDPGVRYSAHAWATDAAGWMRDAAARGLPPVIVGGTGFYVRALVQPLAQTPRLDTTRRVALEAALGAMDGATIGRWCARLDPERAGLGRTQQLRAIETALLTGRRISASFGARPPARAVRYLVVDPGDRLPGRIISRVRAMLEAGWVEEVRSLLERVPATAPAWQASGYGAIREHVEGHVSLAAATERVVIETRQYAKRQRTWNRTQLADGVVTHVDPLAPDAWQRVTTWWDAAGVHTA